MRRTIKATPTETAILAEDFQAFNLAKEKLTKNFTMFAEGKGVPQADLISIASDGNIVVDVPAKKPEPVNPAVRKKKR